MCAQRIDEYKNSFILINIRSILRDDQTLTVFVYFVFVPQEPRMHSARTYAIFKRTMCRVTSHLALPSSCAVFSLVWFVEARE